MSSSNYEPLPYNPLSLILSCHEYISKNIEKVGNISLSKEHKEGLWKYAVKEHYVTDQKFELFLPLFSDSKEVDLEGCDRITDHSINIVAKRHPGITSLNLAWCHYITIASIKNIIQGCPHITSLNLSYTNIDDQALIAIAASYPSIKTLNLQGCQHLSDNGIGKLVHKCTDITSLDLSHIKKSNFNIFQDIGTKLT